MLVDKGNTGAVRGFGAPVQASPAGDVSAEATANAWAKHFGVHNPALKGSAPALANKEGRLLSAEERAGVAAIGVAFAERRFDFDVGQVSTDGFHPAIANMVAQLEAGSVRSAQAVDAAPLGAPDKAKQIARMPIGEAMKALADLRSSGRPGDTAFHAAVVAHLRKEDPNFDALLKASYDEGNAAGAAKIKEWEAWGASAKADIARLQTDVAGYKNEADGLRYGRQSGDPRRW